MFTGKIHRVYHTRSGVMRELSRACKRELMEARTHMFFLFNVTGKCILLYFSVWHTRFTLLRYFTASKRKSREERERVMMIAYVHRRTGTILSAHHFSGRVYTRHAFDAQNAIQKRKMNKQRDKLE